MDKSLEEGDGWTERKRRARNFLLQKSSKIWSLIFKWLKYKKCTHMTSIYSKIGEEVKKKRVQPRWHFSLFRICLEKLFPWRKSKPRRFRNVSVTFSVKNFAKVSTVLRRSSSFFDLQRVSTSNQAFRFILCTRSGPHCVSCIFILVLLTFHTPCWRA